MGEHVNETQECRVYEQQEWRSLVEYVSFLKHRKAYEYVAEQASGKRVLDFACGSGYGSLILAASADAVIGVDASQPAIDYCFEQCRAPNLSFEKIEPNLTLPYEDDSFDLVVSCQVIEHMPDVAGYLRLLKRVLKPGGRLFLTTPNRVFRLLPFQMVWQPAHVREYSARTLDRALNEVFPSHELLGVQGTDAFNRVYIDHYRQTPMRAYVAQPIKLVAGKLLSERSYVSIREALGLAQEKPPAPSEEELARFSLADTKVTSDLTWALDFLAICHHE